MYGRGQNHSTLLDSEAANYFELSADQMQLLNMSSCQTVVSRGGNKNYSGERSIPRKQLPKRPKNQTHNPVHEPATQTMAGKIMMKTEMTNEEVNKKSKRHKKVSRPEQSPNLSVSSDRHHKSPSTSTCSLPSIASSPSLSPSLVCPHLSLDDILSRHENGRHHSAHTIGLCERCLVFPPPDIHSPLSPAFRPSMSRNHQPSYLSSSSTHLEEPKKGPGTMLRRGHSDQQLNRRRIRNRNRLPQDDSLDFYLEPAELRRLQMSPTIRHSVGYIRNNTTEAGRVIRIYKNGRPFDKPLRICIMHGEFANLNHLLDHINSRQLIPSGARYLFHVDGQLVYSENELKHGSCYVVSGTRSFDFKINRVLKEQQQQQKMKQPYRPEIRQMKPIISHQLTLDSPKSPQQVVAKHPIAPTLETLEAERSQAVTYAVKKKEMLIKPEKAEPIKILPPRIVNKKIPVSKLEPADSTIKSNHHKQTTVAKSVATKEPTKQMVRVRSTSGGAGKAPMKKRAQGAHVKSDEYLDHDVEIQERPPTRVMRAKSELSALPNKNKRKKNVTFVDTGRGSSPAISLEPEEKMFGDDRGKNRDEAVSKELETSDIGIQVSDSIEGYLIDLPIALPSKKLVRKPARPAVQKSGQNRQNNMPLTGNRRKHAKVITITERQLSFDEMGKLKDLDQGDHHRDDHKIQHVSITLDSVLDEAEKEAGEADESAEVIVPERGDDTINIGQEPAERKVDDPTGSDRWHYLNEERPGTSSTPTERPVSQSEANETVHARVITPSPSLSTLDNNSLALSYDYNQYQRDDEASAAALASLPAKQRVPVMGTLHNGLDPPQKNFSLVWVNGLIINDHYPDNSTTMASSPSTSSAHGRTDQAKSPVHGLLSPSQTAPDRLPASIQFKPSDRFHNWVCHSRRHDELVYPAGCLVILWSRWTNQQRYYSRHTSNVSAITLASLGDDLAASAQVGDPYDRFNNSSIHLWSLSTLDTLRVVDDDNFRNRHIFSIKLRHTELDGCELSVGAREDKRLWFYVLFLKLESSTSGESTDKQPTKKGGQIVLKASKPSQPNQVPMLITRLSNVRGDQPVTQSSKKSPTDLFGNMMISFGRRHFQVWFVDRKSQSLVPLQALDKSAYFVESIVRANCLVRMSPSEFLIGDSTGNLGFLILSLHQSSESATKTLVGSPSRGIANRYKYSIETWPLIDGSDSSSLEPARNPVTCMTRISGSLFVATDSTCTIKFWRIERSSGGSEKPLDDTKSSISCRLLGCIRLPRDLGFICSIILSKYSRKQPTTVEFYAISTSNAILFGSVQLQSPANETAKSDTSPKAPLACSLSIIYEGHESPAMSLVADPLPSGAARSRNNLLRRDSHGITDQVGDYFTCSLDCKICKWSGKSLVWKSMLPSACASLAAHPTGFVLAVGSADGTVYILDKTSGLLISYFPLTPVCINCLAYSRDGTLLAAGCANGSIFILPVYEQGLKYKKVSILQSPHSVVSLQFSVNNKYILTSVTHGHYQELILWDLPNFRYMRNNAKLTADRIEWFDAICSGSEDVRAIWENANLELATIEAPGMSSNSNQTRASRLQSRKLSTSSFDPIIKTKTIVNLSCHRLVRNKTSPDNLVIASDTRGYLRLFRYPCPDVQQGFYEFRVGSSAVSCCRFLALRPDASINDAAFVSSSMDGSICLWSLC